MMFDHNAKSLFDALGINKDHVSQIVTDVNIIFKNSNLKPSQRVEHIIDYFFYKDVHPMVAFFFIYTSLQNFIDMADMLDELAGKFEEKIQADIEKYN